MGKFCSCSNANDSAANNTTTKELEASPCADQSGAGPSPQNPTTPPRTTSPSASPNRSSKPSKIGPVLGCPMEDVRPMYTIGKELGRGPFGVTHLCTNKWSCTSGLH